MSLPISAFSKKNKAQVSSMKCLTNNTKISANNIFQQSPSIKTIQMNSVTHSTYAITQPYTKSQETLAPLISDRIPFNGIKEPKRKMNFNSNIRRTKLKIKKIIEANPLNNCNLFKNKIQLSNNKITDYLTSPYYHQRQMVYHDKFHYAQNELGESHDKLSMIMKVHPLNMKTIDILDNIESKLTDDEKVQVLIDPNYFFMNKEHRQCFKDFKSRNLSQIIQEEALGKIRKRTMKQSVLKRAKQNNYVFDPPKRNMETELEQKKLEIEKSAKKMLNKHHDKRLLQLSERNTTDVRKLIEKDLTDMVRQVNKVKNKALKFRWQSRENKDEDDEEDENDNVDNKKLTNGEMLLKRIERKKRQRLLRQEEEKSIQTYVKQIEKNYSHLVKYKRLKSLSL